MKQKGVILIIGAIFIFASSLLFSTNSWNSRSSVLENIGQVDIEIFEKVTYEKYSFGTFRKVTYFIDMPLRIVALLCLAMASIGAYILWTSRQANLENADDPST